MRRKVVIIGHGYTSRLAVIRSVAQADCDIIVIVMAWHKRFSKKIDKKKPIDCYSKYVSRFLFCYAKDEEGLVKLLLNECVDPHQKVVIFPDSDVSAAVIDKNQKRLENHFLFPHIHHTPEAIVEWMDKVKQKDLAQEIGMNVVSGQIITICNHSYVLPLSINYPCFTKPLATINGGKLFLRRCNDEKELRKVLDKISCQYDVDVLVENFKEIDEEYAVVGFSDSTNVVIPGIIKFVMNSRSHFGVAREGLIKPIAGFEDMVYLFKIFVKKIGFCGLFDIDFYESDGKMYFSEINLRFGGSGYAVTKMGVNLPSMMVRFLCGEKYTDMPQTVDTEASYVNERMCIDDWAYNFITENECKQIIERADIKFVEDSDDPIPSRKLNQYFNKLRVKRFLRRWLKR